MSYATIYNNYRQRHENLPVARQMLITVLLIITISQLQKNIKNFYRERLTPNRGSVMCSDVSRAEGPRLDAALCFRAIAPLQAHALVSIFFTVYPPRAMRERPLWICNAVYIAMYGHRLILRKSSVY